MTLSIRSIMLATCLLFSSMASADDFYAYLVVHVPDDSQSDVLNNVASLSLSNCLHEVEQSLDVIVVRVHCNAEQELTSALTDDLYPLIARHLRSQWFTTGH